MDTQERVLDPITLEVMRGAFEYISDRMSNTLQRASFSPIIYDMVDFSNALFDADGELVGQSANCPVHLAAMHFSTQAGIDHVGRDNFRPGDVVILNDPYAGGTHVNDVTMFSPIFLDEELLGFGCSRAHWTDLGGGGPGGITRATHIAAEGLRLPPMKLCNGGVLDENLVAIMRAATRTPQYVDGDIQAQIGALKTAELELQRLATRHGADLVLRAMVELQDYTERITRAAVGSIPNGTYEASDYTDTDGLGSEPYIVRVALTVSDDAIHADFSGTSKQALGLINSPIANTLSALYYSLKFFLGHEAPANAGMYRVVSYTVPEGTWLNPAWPAPTIGSTTVAASKICAAVWLALAKAIPERILAPTYSENNWYSVSMLHPDTGHTHVHTELPTGGWGGTPFNDGMHVTIDPLGNDMVLEVETAEMLHPMEAETLEFWMDSGGAGAHRGGLGSVSQMRFRGQTEFGQVTARTREGSLGVNGGHASPPQRSERVGSDGATEILGGLTETGEWRNCFVTTRFAPDEAFRFYATGGGGWGDPLERPAADVLDDVLDELVSIDAASNTYGVVLDPSAKAVDVAGTEKRRAAMRAAARRDPK
jgi:N-methylhydantoinase B